MHILDYRPTTELHPQPPWLLQPLAGASCTQLHDFLEDNSSGLERMVHPEPRFVSTESDGESRSPSDAAHH